MAQFGVIEDPRSEHVLSMTPHRPSQQSMHGQVVILTGGNAGLGYSTAKGLAELGAFVVLACRSKVRAEAALQNLRSDCPGGQFAFLPLDLCDLASVRAFVEGYRNTVGQPVDVLINNAGILPGHERR